MENWKNFETECYNFLCEKFSNFAKFQKLGSSNSTVSDILVTTNNKEFFVEVKHLPAQCGQFVLLPDIKNKLFEYSSKNIIKVNEYSQEIIKHMNNNFEEFKNAGTSGKTIIFENSENVFSKWIINYYKGKNVKFFIINNLKLLHIEKINKYFNITAKYRVKRSGSSGVSPKMLKPLSEYITKSFSISKSEIISNKLFTISDTDLNNFKFIFENQEYMFSLKTKNTYEIRKLSNTYNANVIFSIKLKDYVDDVSDEEFIEELK